MFPLVLTQKRFLLACLSVSVLPQINNLERNLKADGNLGNNLINTSGRAIPLHCAHSRAGHTIGFALYLSMHSIEAQVLERETGRSLIKSACLNEM